MKRKEWITVVFILLLLVCGCKKSPEPTLWEGDILLYYPDETETGLLREWYVTEEEDGYKLAAELLQKLCTPLGKERISAIPESVKLPEVFIEASGLATLLFDESYGSVSGVREVLMRAAIVKTLCQTEKIDAVEIYVAGQPLMNAQKMPVGIMKETDFIDSTGPEANYYQYLYAKIYYANQDGTGLVASNLKIPYTGSEAEEKIVLQQLINGPIEADMQAVLSDKVKIRSVSTKDNVCTVDFSKEFLDKLPDVSEEVVLYSVVNTLAELPGIYQVQFLVEGKQEKLYQTMDLTGVYERNLNVVEKE
ncbi:MAG: GerMN domain-containing protein [Lachnospiraceae bacterium]|nr:GerMN domain-containing protein [Lachnospiraceae bacterium]MBQ8549471.1 GerMN domain-containing protein [Lachnospiraceae bacterium]MBQ8847145.1 GerMN domain-containing protein [Lachnospiraceae bacterium]